MISVPEPVAGQALRERAGADLPARLMLGPAAAGFRLGDAVAWRTPPPDDGVICVRGGPAGAGKLVDALRTRGLLLRPGDRVRMPAGARAALPHVEDWTLLATGSAATGGPARAEVLPGPAAPALVAEVLGAGIGPAADHLAWFGIRQDGRLLAAGEARSCNGFGYLARICVAVTARRRGLGAELTTAMTARLLRRHRAVVLGVRTDNPAARRLYERLGFAGVLDISSFVVPGRAPITLR